MHSKARHCKEIVEVLLNEQGVKPRLREPTRYDSDLWYLDIGASYHMTGSKTKFTDLDTTVSGIVRFGEGSTMDICGRGTVLFECQDSGNRALTDVYYIPKLISNIVSLSQLKEHGCRLVLEGGLLHIFDQ